MGLCDVDAVHGHTQGMVTGCGQALKYRLYLGLQVFEGIRGIIRWYDRLLPHRQVLAQLIHRSRKHLGTVQMEPYALLVGS